MTKTAKTFMYGSVLAVVLVEVGLVAGQMKHTHHPVAAIDQNSQEPTDSAAASEEAAIRQVLVEQTTAWNAGNVEAFMKAYKDASDTTFIGAHVRQGYQPIQENYRKNYSSKLKMGTLTFSELNVRVLDAKYAIVTGKFHLSRPKSDKGAKNDGVFSLVWEKTDAGWKIILDHTS